MPIRPYLTAGQIFEPDAIREMSRALQRVCWALGVKRVDDPLNREIAAKIIELAQRGVTGNEALYVGALKELPKH